jgi:hypothetical protein
MDAAAWAALGAGDNVFFAGGVNLDLDNYRREILKPLLDLDLFPDRSAIAAHQTLIQALYRPPIMRCVSPPHRCNS